ncbi:MAG: DUF3131 domain-containing protein [Cyanobacteria bacterium P01_F01_bin.53]
MNILSKRWMRGISLFLVGFLISTVLNVSVISPRVVAQEGGQCGANPLTEEEWGYAQSAWNYFVDNVQPDTGLPNAAGGYPSGTLWDMGNYLTAMNAARWMGLIEQSEFDSRLNQFLGSLAALRLFEDKLPNKVYNSATGEMVDYGNNPLDRGIGWSALDIGRMLAAFRMIQNCHPQYNDWINGVVEGWQVALSVKDEKLYGAAVLEDDSTLMVQEGRLGYEEYASRGYELWGYHVPQAISFEPFKFVDIYGIQIPVDTRDYQTTNANNYVVSESYILDAIEFGLEGELADYARRVFEVQKRRFEDTGLLTAVSEDNINQPPYFLYSTVYSNGEPFAVITEKNELHPEMRTLSTKAAFGWHYVYPDSPYAQQIFDHVKNTNNSGRGYYAGIYESGLYDENPPLNDILTGNTNGLLLEILYYKARGNKPLIGGDVTVSGGSASTGDVAVAETPPPEPVPAEPAPTAPTTTEASLPEPPPVTESAPPESAPPEPAPPEPAPESPPAESGVPIAVINNEPPPPSPPPPPPESPPPEPAAAAPAETTLAIAPIDPVASASHPVCPVPSGPISITDQRYARNAWQYFESNHQTTGLVNDRGDLDGVTLWGIGDYIAALHAAHSLGTITNKNFDTRVRHVLAGIRELPLFAGELPHRAYNSKNLNPTDYGGNHDPDGNGWSGLDVGRLLAALHTLKACHPQYTEAVDKIALDWSYLRVVRNGLLANAELQADDRGRDRVRVNPATLLGYEEYAARAFQLWGFDVSRSVVGNDYETVNVEGQPIPLKRRNVPPSRKPTSLNTISTPFILYGLEFGFDPKMRAHVDAIFQAEAARYERTGNFSASGTTFSTLEPHIIHSTILSNGERWKSVNDVGEEIARNRMVSTAVAFAYLTLYPDHPYSQALWQATLDLYNPTLGYYEGFFELTGYTAIGFGGGTNSLILQALLHKNTERQPLIQPRTDLSSPWWDAVRAGDTGQGLPETVALPIDFVADGEAHYWISAGEAPATAYVPDATDSPTVALATTLESIQDSSVEDAAPANSSAVASSPAEETSEEISQPEDSANNPSNNPSATVMPLSDKDQQSAQMAWAYIDNNWNADTGFVNAVERYPWTTLWDQGSGILGLHSAYQLGLLSKANFEQRLDRLLDTLESLPLPDTGLPNKAYSTLTGEMRSLDNQPDAQGRSGWSALDTARYLLSLDVLRTHYAAYSDRIERIVNQYDLTRLEKDGWLIGSGLTPNGEKQLWQEGRLGYEQYAAYSLKRWGIEAEKALYSPPVEPVVVENVSLQADLRNFANSGAVNSLTSDPYTLWGLELGWPEDIVVQAQNLFQAQEKRFERTGILTAVNEDSLDRPPYFLYYSVYANGEPWSALTSSAAARPDFRTLSTKAAFSWAALYPQKAYAQKLRDEVQFLGDRQRGYFAGRYEDDSLGPNVSININTNAIILESLLYKARGQRPLIVA